MSSLACHQCAQRFELQCGPNGCNPDDVKRVFKRLALKYHTDKAPRDRVEEYSEIIKQVNHCKDILMEQCQRPKARAARKKSSQSWSQRSQVPVEEYSQAMAHDIQVALNQYGATQSALMEHNWRLKKPLEQGQANLAQAFSALLESVNEYHHLQASEQAARAKARPIARAQKDMTERLQYLQRLAENYAKAKK